MFPASGVDAAKIQGDAVSVKDPTSGQGLVWDEYTKQWVPSSTGSGGGTWGSIGGTLSDQADLQTALDGKQAAGSYITDIAATTHAATSKTTPVDADEVPLVDSAASNGLKNLTWANIKTVLANVFASLTGATFSGNVTMEGVANTCPNQTLLSGSYIVNRDLADLLLIDPRIMVLRDDFMCGGQTSTNNIGELRWSLSGTGAAVTGQNIAFPNGGVVRLATTTSTGDQAGVHLTPPNSVSAMSWETAAWDARFVLRVSATTNIRIRVGIGGRGNAALTASSSAGRGVYYRYDTDQGDASWTLIGQGVVSGSNTVVAATASGVAPSTSAFHTLRIRRTSATTFAASVNGGSEQTLNLAGMTLNVQYSYPVIAVETRTTSSAHVEVDFFSMLITGLAR